MSQIIIPKLYCPFPSAVSPHAEAVDQATCAWAARWGLISDPAIARRLRAIGAGWLAARTNPTAPLDGLQLLADWCTWLFLLDDQCDEGALGADPTTLRYAHARSIAILQGAEPAAQDGATGAALADLRDRIRQRATAAWMNRFTDTVVATFEASIWEATNRAGGTTPDVHTYMAYRSSTGAMYTVLALAEIMEGIDLPDEVKGHPVVQELETHAINAVCWANDIISLAKELKHGDVHNLVVALQRTNKLSLKDAIYRAAALHDAQVRAFLDLQLRLPTFGTALDARVSRYVAVLRSWMRGNLDWAKGSGRYLAAVMTSTDLAART